MYLCFLYCFKCRRAVYSALVYRLGFVAFTDTGRVRFPDAELFCHCIALFTGSLMVSCHTLNLNVKHIRLLLTDAAG